MPTEQCRGRLSTPSCGSPRAHGLSISVRLDVHSTLLHSTGYYFHKRIWPRMERKRTEAGALAVLFSEEVVLVALESAVGKRLATLGLLIPIPTLQLRPSSASLQGLTTRVASWKLPSSQSLVCSRNGDNHNETFSRKTEQLEWGNERSEAGSVSTAAKEGVIHGTRGYLPFVLLREALSLQERTHRGRGNSKRLGPRRCGSSSWRDTATGGCT